MLQPVQAHQPDTSYLNLRIGDTEVQSAYLCDVTTLQRIVPDLDANHDGSISRDEGEGCRQVVVDYLQRHLFLDLDGDTATWGESKPLSWPNPDLSPIARADWHQLLIQFPFQLAVQHRPKQVQVTCDLFIELGTNHKMITEFRAGEGDLVRHPVVCTLDEPDYLFDVDSALAHAPGGAKAILAQPAAVSSEQNWRSFVRSGIRQSLTPSVFLTLLSILVPAGWRAAGRSLGILFASQLLTAVPASLLGLPVAFPVLQTAIALVVLTGGLANLWPSLGGNLARRLAMLSGMVYGLAFGAGLREICLVPQRPVDALLPYQAGVTIALLAAGGILTVILQALGTWKPGSVLPRVLALAVLGVGLALLARPYQ